MQPKPEFTSISPGNLVAVTEIDLGALSEIYDEMDIYLSIYMKSASTADLDASRSHISSRFRVMEKSLPSELRESFQKTVSLAQEAIDLSLIHI